MPAVQRDWLAREVGGHLLALYGRSANGRSVASFWLSSSICVGPYVLLRLSCDGAVRPTLAAFNEGLLGEQGLKPGRRTVVDCSEFFVGMDVSKDRHAVAEGGRDGEVPDGAPWWA